MKIFSFIVEYVSNILLALLLVPPVIFSGCLIVTNGDLEMCSMGIWDNFEYEGPCDYLNREWFYELSYNEAQCYLDRYPDSRKLSEMISAKLRSTGKSTASQKIAIHPVMTNPPEPTLFP